MGMMINRRRVYGGGKEPLPQGAVRIEYLQGWINQYIDTMLFVSNSNLEIRTTVKRDAPHYAEFAICGNQDNHDGRFVFGIYQNYVYGFSRNGSNGENNVTSATIQYDQPINIVLKYDYTNAVKTLNVDGTITSASYVRSITNSNQTVKLFCDGGKKYYFEGKIYNISLYSDDVKLRDFIPVRIGTTGYMYDKVSKQLFGNAGTGDFILGPDK